MTPAQHYAEAQRLVAWAENQIPDDEPAQLAYSARAQVHATLAAAGAIVTLSAKDLRPDDAYKFLKRSGWYDAWNLGDQPESRQEKPDAAVGDVD